MRLVDHRKPLKPYHDSGQHVPRTASPAAHAALAIGQHADDGRVVTSEGLPGTRGAGWKSSPQHPQQGHGAGYQCAACRHESDADLDRKP